MSEEQEGFLNRWSRRKQEAEKESAQPEVAKTSEETAAADGKNAVEETPEQEFDISKLPPVESITATTDIRAFLAKGVPAALTQAALRRAWSADPAIRDYIGLSEYSWDFNAPGQFGFGELDPSLNVQEMVAEMFGKVKQAATDAEAFVEKTETLAPQTEPAPAQEAPANSVELRRHENDAESESRPTETPIRTEFGDKTAQAADAPQQPKPENIETPLPVRRHGSALPS